MGDYTIDFKIQNNFSFDIYCGISYIDDDGNEALSADLSLCTAGETKITISQTLNRKGTANAVFVDNNSILWTCQSFSLNTDRENGTLLFQFTVGSTYEPGGPYGTGNFIYVFDQKDRRNGSSQFAPVCKALQYTPT